MENESTKCDVCGGHGVLINTHLMKFECYECEGSGVDVSVIETKECA